MNSERRQDDSKTWGVVGNDILREGGASTIIDGQDVECEEKRI